MYKSEPSLSATVTSFFTAFSAATASEPLPLELSLIPTAFNLPAPPSASSSAPPGAGTATFMVLMTWHTHAPSPTTLSRFEAWHRRVQTFAPFLASTVARTTPLAAVRASAALVPPSVVGTTRTFSLARLSPRAVALVAGHVERMPPDPVCGFAVHQLRGVSAAGGAEDGTGGGGGGGGQDCAWRNRRPHWMLELIGTGRDARAAEEGDAWARAFRKDAMETLGVEGEDEGGKAGEVMDAIYIALTGPGDLQLERVYGRDNLARLRELKAKYDPEGLFKHTVPQL